MYMNNGAFFSTFILNVFGCMISCLYVLKNVRARSITKAKGRWLYLIAVLAITGIAGILSPDVFIRAYERIGFLQDVGHGYYGYVIILNAGVGLVMLLVGQIIVGWENIEF